MTLYDTLGVKKTASKDDIKRAYRGEAKRLHPDTGDEPDAPAFAKATHAYKLLTDETRRKKYDETGREDDSGLDDPVFLKAIGMIGMVFNQIMDDENALSRNIPRDMEREIKSIRTKIDTQIENGRKRQKKLERAKAKLTRKKGRKGRDMMLHVIDQSLRDIAHPLAMLKIDLDAANMALEMLDADGYDFKADAPPPPSAYQQRPMSIMDIIQQATRNG